MIEEINRKEELLRRGLHVLLSSKHTNYTESGITLVKEYIQRVHQPHQGEEDALLQYRHIYYVVNEVVGRVNSTPYADEGTELGCCPAAFIRHSI